MQSEWLQWYTLIFTLPAGLAILLLLLVGVGSLDNDGGGADDGGDGGDGDAGLDLDADDAGLDMDADAGDAGHGGHDGHNIHYDDGGHGDPGFGHGLRSVLGIGQVPLTIGGGGLLLGWGIGGLAALEILLPLFLPPEAFVPFAVLIALVSAMLFARLISRIYMLVIPRTESAAVSRHNLVGFSGTAIFPITATSGQIHLRDQFGTLHQAPARVRPEQPSIPRGTAVLVLDIDADGGLFIVEPAEMTNESILPGAL